MKCQIFTFENLNWSQIPDHSNPMYLNLNNKNFYGIIICKVLPQEGCLTGMNGYIVTDISNRFVACRRLGVFWDLENAKLFASAYAHKIDNFIYYSQWNM